MKLLKIGGTFNFKISINEITGEFTKMEEENTTPLLLLISLHLVLDLRARYFYCQ